MDWAWWYQDLNGADIYHMPMSSGDSAGTPSNRSDIVTPPSQQMARQSADPGVSSCVSSSPVCTWPVNHLPVEIFEHIISYISRGEIRNLRLVCREFESKATAEYFRNVVVPFKSELYSTLSHDKKGALRSTTPLFSDGMRTFQSFGRHIVRFALSLELDEDTLAYPPVKPGQEAIPTFWGVYRWPYPEYNRYTDLEDLEQTADETKAMKAALKCLSRVTNLGLCCDAGLGFLNGPDYIARRTVVPQPVFATRNWRQTVQGSDKREQPIVAVAPFSNGETESATRLNFDNPISFKRDVLEKMAADAGFKEHEFEEAIRLILKTEDTTLTQIDLEERMSQSTERRAAYYRSSRTEAGSEATENATSKHPLIPVSLTRAQKELLLELEWAHRAMIQSYVVALIDNAYSDSFSNLTTLTIAKIPSSHLHIFYRHELWGSLSHLTNVHLGVIADWRRISKLAPGCIDDAAISPLEAVGRAYHLLNKYIGITKNIESLHFEWICGGELAPGTHQRNRHILPAPFFPRPELMVSPDSPRAQADTLLSLPFVKHLSLKNCWASPHVLLETIRQMALSSLEKLEMETVSLSGPPTTVPQQGLLQQVLTQPYVPPIYNPHYINLLAFPPGGSPPLGQPQPSVQPQEDAPPPLLLPTLEQPEWLSWAGIVEQFSPSLKIRDVLRRRFLAAPQDVLNPEDKDIPMLADLATYLPRTRSLLHEGDKYLIKCLSFKSCGYVAIDSPTICTRDILPPNSHGLGRNLCPHPQDLSSMMQQCRDKLLGRVVPHLRVEEAQQLVGFFGMELGWANVYGYAQRLTSAADGVEYPGEDRFTGVLEWCAPEEKDTRMSLFLPQVSAASLSLDDSGTNLI